MNEISLKEYLAYTTKDKLVKKMRVIGLKYSGLNKQEVIDSLANYLLNKDNIEKLWNSLSPFEKEYMNEFLKYDEEPDSEIKSSLSKKYDVDITFNPYNSWKEKKKIGVFFINKKVPVPVKNMLNKYLDPIVVKYNTRADLPEKSRYQISQVRESFASDFMQIIDLVSNLELYTDEEGDNFPGREAIIMINDVLYNKDFILDDIGDIKDIKNIEDTNRIYAIFMIMLESNLLKIKNKIEVTNSAGSFLADSLVKKVQFLFKNYCNSGRIFEFDRIVESEFSSRKKGDMSSCRRVIIKHLKQCPVGEWIAVAEFINYIKMKDKNFLKNEVGELRYYSDKHKVYLEPWIPWEEIEGRLVEVILQEYLSVLGLVDTAFYEDEGGCHDYYYCPFFKVDYFRITSLGSCILGMSKDYYYVQEKKKAGFSVENDFFIKMKATPENQIHRLYFERFAGKEDLGNSYLFKISFVSIMKALDQGITVDSIIEYIQINSLNEVPAKLLDTLRKWDNKSGKVEIKNITIVQTESIELMEELIDDIIINQYIENKLDNSFEINQESVDILKHLIESKGYYCKVKSTIKA